jgi:catechol-2,3-dioxygenase
VIVPLKRVAEVVWVSEDPERASRFYREVLGLEIPGEALGVNVAEVGEQLVGFAAEEQVHGFRPLSAGKLHLAFEIEWEDFDRAVEELDRRGVATRGPITFPFAFHGPAGSRAIYFEDPDGNQLELWARPK